MIKYIGKEKMGVVVPKGGRGSGESDREAEGWGADDAATPAQLLT